MQSIPKGPNLNLELVLIRKVLNVYQKLINRKTSVRPLTRETIKRERGKATKVIFSPTPVLSPPPPSLPGRPGRAPYPPSEPRRPFSCPSQPIHHSRYTVLDPPGPPNVLPCSSSQPSSPHRPSSLFYSNARIDVFLFITCIFHKFF